MRSVLTLALLVVLVFGSGCFVFEEIDSGMEIMEAHTPAENKKKQEAAKAGSDDGEAPPTYDQAVHSWWKDASSLPVEADDPEAEADPNATVSCQHDGKTFFTRRSDCLARGGRPV